MYRERLEEYTPKQIHDNGNSTKRGRNRMETEDKEFAWYLFFLKT